MFFRYNRNKPLALNKKPHCSKQHTHCIVICWPMVKAQCLCIEHFTIKKRKRTMICRLCRMDGQTSGWTDGRMDRWMRCWIHVHILCPRYCWNTRNREVGKHGITGTLTNLYNCRLYLLAWIQTNAFFIVKQRTSSLHYTRNLYKIHSIIVWHN